MKMNKVENTPLEKENKEHYENLVGWKTWNKGLTNQKNMKPHRYNEIAKEQEWHNFDSTPVEKRRELDKMKRNWRDDTTLRLNG